MTPYGVPLDILCEDNHLIGLNKPAGWPTTHFEGTDETVDRMVKDYLKEKYQKPGNVFLGVVHRLDKPTSGALIFARTSKAAARLSEQFKNGTAKKIYWAVVNETNQSPSPQPSPARGEGVKLPDNGTMEDHLFHDDLAHQVRVVPVGTIGAKPARLLFTVKARSEGKMLLELRPRTGRKHQLRVQLASRGYPILGDVKYGSTVTFDKFIALHARSLTVLHPITKEPIILTAGVPHAWTGRFAKLLG